MPGFPKNPLDAVRQLKKVQEMVEQKQKELGEMRVEATAGGGMVKVIANGKEEIINIKIDREVVNPDDVPMLEDLVLAAIKEAQVKAKEIVQREMGGLMSNLGLPNIPGL